jgi:hypothetical protein
MWGEDMRDMANLITEKQVKEGHGAQVLCEGCGYILVDHNGVRIKGLKAPDGYVYCKRCGDATNEPKAFSDDELDEGDRVFCPTCFDSIEEHVRTGGMRCLRCGCPLHPTQPLHGKTARYFSHMDSMYHHGFCEECYEIVEHEAQEAGIVNDLLL